MTYIPEQGDIIELDFDPSAGVEIKKTRPALVLSAKTFNEQTGLCYVAPITTTEPKHTLALPFKGMRTHGAVLTHQVRSFDYRARNGRFIEKMSPPVLNQALDIMKVIFN